MNKILLLSLIVLIAISSDAQIIGNLVSIYPNSAEQGQTLTTTITEQSGSFMLGSPPCDNYGIYLLQGGNTIYSNSFNWQSMDIFDAEFSIPAAAPLGFYDVYVASTHYDWWSGTCVTLGYWVLTSGFEVTLANRIQANTTEFKNPSVSPNPFGEKATFSFGNNERKRYTLTVMDSYGREVYHEIIDSDNTTLSRKNFEAGIYYYKLDGQENNYSFTGKFVVIE